MDSFLVFALAMICVAPVLGAIAGAINAHVNMRRDARAYRAARTTAMLRNY
jgi:hypothetical protein